MHDTQHVFLWNYNMKKIQYDYIAQIKIVSFAKFLSTEFTKLITFSDKGSINY